MNTFPHNSELSELASVREGFEKYLIPCYRRFPLVAVRGQGSYLWDAEGKKYLDFASGIAVNTLGHASPIVRNTLEEQASRLVHCSNLYYHPWAFELAKWLVERIGPGKVFFCNSGAEANECLFKLARRYGNAQGKFEIICARNSFHGRTLACISATGQEKVQKGFAPLVPGFVFGEFNDLASFEKQITKKTAAILVEPIQGEGGVHPADTGFLLGLRKLAWEKGALLFLDEVQTGCFRTGRFLGFQRILEERDGAKDFLPDGISLAKGLGGGFPMGAVWIREPYASLLDPGSHASTFGGNPLACSIGLAVLRAIEKENLGLRMRKFERQVREGLREWIGSNHKIREIRGIGGLLGLALRANAWESAEKLLKAGLLTVPASQDVLRLLPPLTVTEEETQQALEILASILV
ncbi:acetylornithine/succinylornithine family transaminase [Candidatus Methylacidithermus pantelleriae]|uniref:Acetylornithine aminotransferase n=1 Tax=Candidatus Methylacidithermus pantelleriae TaxID=2744239 RepID=A0A8J2FSX6_9BACT|nr:acetylornithine/succinylornithine family transaminase [Candidatus Methylacidithermus pantelleriae]CAF0699132.1 Acetylornithine aminotransferase [Candidatus Methylacidithermus pantelleriae]